MESANLRHQYYDQLQDHHRPGSLSASSSSSSSSSSSLDTTHSFYGADTFHSWAPSNTTFLRSSDNITNSSVAVANSRIDPTMKHGIVLESLLQNNPSLQISLRSDLWNNRAPSNLIDPDESDLGPAYTKEDELPAGSFPTFTELLNGAQAGIEDLRFHHPKSHMKNNELTSSNDLSELSQKLMLKTLFSTCQSNLNHFSSSGDGIYPGALQNYVRPGVFSQIHPSIDISNLYRSSGSMSCCLDVNSPALDLLNGRFSTNIRDSFHEYNNGGVPGETLPFGLQHMQQSAQDHDMVPPCISSKTTEAKRLSSSLEPETTSPQSQVAPKKTRLEPTRASSASFKVRKEKLGDRIAALHQLVAPFGKTDTASVLMEAIGYIKFLQNQVQTLSVPYMKSSRKEAGRPMQGVLREDENDEEHPTRDLRSRGLCLLPLSCMSYVANDGGGGGVWPLPSAQP